MLFSEEKMKNELTGPKLSFTRSRKHDEPGEPIESTHTLEIVLQNSPQRLLFEDAYMKPGFRSQELIIRSHFGGWDWVVCQLRKAAAYGTGVVRDACLYH